MSQSRILLEAGTNELEIIEFAIRFQQPDGTTMAQPLGINVTKVREVIRMQPLTTLPDMMPGVRGMISLREQLIPVLDLGFYLYGPDAAGEYERLVVTEFNNFRLALMVSDVSRIHRISWQDVEPPTSIRDVDPHHSTVIGLVTMGEKNILMIDVEKIVAGLDPKLAVSSSDEVDSLPDGANYTVLMAEDSETIRGMVHQQLEEVGFNVIVTKDGMEAWETLNELAGRQTAKAPVDVIVTDLEMPRMDGYTLTKNIKAHPRLADVPVLIFSSMVAKDNLHKGQSVGADHQLTKPELVNLVNTIYDHLGVRQAA
ncbi:MAG: chemotaxis protein [Rhodothermales bacterium]